MTNQAYEAYNKLKDTYGTLFATTIEAATTNLNDDAKNFNTAIEALVAMNKTVDRLNEVAAYVNIEDYAKEGVIYEKLYNLVYGQYVSGVDFFGEDTSAGRRYAMWDIVDIATVYDDEVVDQVVAEYKAWIDYALAFEAHKAEVIAQLDALIAEEFTAENDYTAAQIAKATSKTNAAYVAIVNAIAEEVDPTAFVTGATTAGQIEANATVVGNANRIIATSFTNIVKNAESFEEATELMAEAFDIDRAFSVFEKTWNVDAHA